MPELSQPCSMRLENDFAVNYFEANAKPGFRFNGWYSNGSLVSETPEYSYDMFVSYELTAGFEPDSMMRTVTDLQIPRTPFILRVTRCSLKPFPPNIFRMPILTATEELPLRMRSSPSGSRVAPPAVETEAGFCVRLKIIHGEIILKPHGAVHITAGLCFKVNIELSVPLAVVVPANFGKFVAGRVKLKQLLAVRKIENAGNIVAGNIQPFQCFAAGRINFGKAAVIGGNVHKVGI